MRLIPHPSLPHPTTSPQQPPFKTRYVLTKKLPDVSEAVHRLMAAGLDQQRCLVDHKTLARSGRRGEVGR